MDDLTLFADLRPDDVLPHEDLAEIRAQLFDSHAVLSDRSRAMRRSPALPVDLTDRSESDLTPPRRSGLLIAAATVVGLGVAGVWVVSDRASDPPLLPATQQLDTPTTSATSELNNGSLADPAATIFGAHVQPLLPAGYELVFASDGPEPLIVALNAGGDRFEAVIYSSPQRLSETDRIADELQLETPEGVIAVGPNGEPDERGAYLVADDVIVTTTFSRVADAATIPAGTAVDVARSIARDLPPSLITGEGPRVGTQTFNEVGAAIELLAERIDESGGTVLDARAPTVEVAGQFTASSDASGTTVRVELFDGFLAPRSVIQLAESDPERRRVVRAGTWLTIVTIEGELPPGSALLAAAARSVSAVVGPVPLATPDSEGPATTVSSLPTTVPDADATLLVLDPPPAGYQLTQAEHIAGPGRAAVALYSTPETSTDLQLVIRNGPLPVELLRSLDRATWDFGGRTVWSDGELEGCLPDVCSIGLQWDDDTYISLMWVNLVADDLVAGSTQQTLLDLLPNLVERDSGWQAVDQFTEPEDMPSTVPSTALPIAQGDVLVANANSFGGSAGRLSAMLSDIGFSVDEAVNTSASNQSETAVYVAPGAFCLGLQVASALGDISTTTMPDVIPIASPNSTKTPDVLVQLGNDLAEQIDADDLVIDLGPAGRLLVVDASGASRELDAQLAALDAADIAVAEVLPSTRPTAETTFHPIGGTTPWSCGVADAVGVDGFDDWAPDLLEGDLPDGTDAVLVIGG